MIDNKIFDIGNFSFKSEKDIFSTQHKVKINNISKKEIAIVGMHGRFALADNMEEFWKILSAGSECIREFPYIRKRDIYSATGIKTDSGKAGYLNEIDKFDYQMFGLSLNEAKMIDPNQRLFLEAAWSAIEEAGYGGDLLKGTRTGVYVGFCNDTSIGYKRYMEMVNPSLAVEYSLAGNLKSVIASRIAYLLDFSGPSMVIDTACSSALVALHLACQAIHNGQCDQAIVGGVNLRLLPVKSGITSTLGMKSPNEKVRSFDDDSDGFCTGEGVAAILIKPLNRAVNDRDHIHAVIKGSAVNQDGKSVGITAPNSAAQEDVILSSWKAAGIDPETISCIEAHGTGTKLGDPIEISGIERAFRNYTDKKQFCAISAVKSNIGHLDSAAGMPGLFKLVLAMKNKKLPPTINFKKPNRKIDFINSPVYINDKLSNWNTEGYPRRCGISSFGLSGTNCHVVLEEYIEEKDLLINEEKQQILTLSAESKEQIIELLKMYREFLDKKDQEFKLGDICYTANTGRKQLSYRLAIICENISELKEKIQYLQENDKLDSIIQGEKGIYYGRHKIVTSKKSQKAEWEITEEETVALYNEASLLLQRLSTLQGSEYKETLERIASMYTRSANIDFKILYKGFIHKKVSLPVYPFKRNRCWIEEPKEKQDASELDNLHPLLGSLVVQSYERIIYKETFSKDSKWVLGEHQVNGNYVVPGTAYIEMAVQAYAKAYGSYSICLKDVIFLAPLKVDEEEERDVHTILKIDKEPYEFVIVSRKKEGFEWTLHAEGKIEVCSLEEPARLDLEQIQQRIHKYVDINRTNVGREGRVTVGPHWRGIRRRGYIGENEYFACCELAKEYDNDLMEYYIHPSIMDQVVNISNSTIGSGLYLPLAYKSIRIFGKMPMKLYTHIIKRSNESLESGTFDITLFTEDGSVIGQIEGYTVKRVDNVERSFAKRGNGTSGLYAVNWLQKNQEVVPDRVKPGNILLFKGEGSFDRELVQCLKDNQGTVVEVQFGEAFEKVDENHYIISGEEEDYEVLVKSLAGININYIMHLSSMLQKNIEKNSVEQLETQEKRSIYSIFYLVKALVNNKINQDMELILISSYANRITGEESSINPLGGALLSIGRVIASEYQNIKVKCIDTDFLTPASRLCNELTAETEYSNGIISGYRNGIRYIQEFGKAEFEEKNPKQVELKDTGVYLITGGSGGIGLEMAKYLVQKKNNIRIALVSRTKLPPKDVWTELQNEEGKLGNLIRSILEMESMGAYVSYYSLDVSDIKEMESLEFSLIEKHKRINGIIHCAGVAGDGFIFRKNKEIFDSVVRPKVLGTFILSEIFENGEPDFFVMCSSISSYFGGRGQADYVAANSFMDSYAAYMNGLGKNIIAINWPAWKEVGMAVEFGVHNKKGVFSPITSLKALQTFELILSYGATGIIAGDLDIEYISSSDYKFPIALAEDIKLKSTLPVKKVSERIKAEISVIITGKNSNLLTETDMKIANVWARVLGLTEVDIYDNFSSLGGDSILAIRLLKELEKEFPGVVDISDVFTYSTIESMSNYINEKVYKDKLAHEKIDDSDKELDDILRKLANGEISVTDVDKLMSLDK